MARRGARGRRGLRAVERSHRGTGRIGRRPRRRSRGRRLRRRRRGHGDFKPVWIRDGAWTASARAVRDRLRQAGEDGLDPGVYAVPDSVAAPAGPGEVAQAELRLSVAAVLYARDARGARIEPWRL